MVDPFREKRFGASDVRRILRRAAELADRDPETQAVERALTRGEIERAAEQFGLPASAVARALDGGEEEEEAASSGGSWFLGAPTRIAFEEDVAGEPSESEREDLLDEIREYMGETGSIESVGKTLVWKGGLASGRGHNVSVRVRARQGRTRIVIEEGLLGQALGLFLGLGFGGGLGPMGGYIMAIMKLGVVGIVFPLLWIPLMVVLARTIFRALAERRERKLRGLMKRLKQSSVAWSVSQSPPQLRIARPAPVDQGDTQGQAEIEAQAEEEAGSRARS